MAQSESPKKSAQSTPLPSAGMDFEAPVKELEAQLEELHELSKGTQLDISSEMEALRAKINEALEATYA